ncbi:MAG: PA4642 family protein [Alcanivorax sp.]|nr:PA4642 family protein [Alcanivorax sp.]
MAERKDKQKVIGEPMTDEQIKVFLDFPTEAGVDGDFHVLEKAYRALRVEDFARLLAFFVEQGRNINACDPQGRTLLTLVSDHGRSKDYAQALRDAGAQ